MELIQKIIKIFKYFLVFSKPTAKMQEFIKLNSKFWKCNGNNGEIKILIESFTNIPTHVNQVSLVAKALEKKNWIQVNSNDKYAI